MTKAAELSTRQLLDSELKTGMPFVFDSVFCGNVLVSVDVVTLHLAA